jgi:hypothetical protein
MASASATATAVASATVVSSVRRSGKRPSEASSVREHTATASWRHSRTHRPRVERRKRRRISPPTTR